MSQGFTKNISIPVPVSQGGTGTTTSTGTGSVVLSNSPALVTPALGTPSALILTNATGDQLGVTNGSAAAAGHVGEIFDTGILNGTYTGGIDNVATLNLPAGNWLILASILFAPSPLAAGIATVIGSISLVPNALVPIGDISHMQCQNDVGTAGLTSHTMKGFKTFNFTATTSIYLTSQATSSTTIVFYGQMIALRIR